MTAFQHNSNNVLNVVSQVVDIKVPMCIGSFIEVKFPFLVNYEFQNSCIYFVGF